MFVWQFRDTLSSRQHILLNISTKIVSISHRGNKTTTLTLPTDKKAASCSRQHIKEILPLSQWIWIGHVSRSSGLAKTILQGTVQGGRTRGRQKKRWENNIAEWTRLKFCRAVREAENKIKWRERVTTSVAPQRSLHWLRERCRCRCRCNEFAGNRSRDKPPVQACALKTEGDSTTKEKPRPELYPSLPERKAG